MSQYQSGLKAHVHGLDQTQQVGSHRLTGLAHMRIFQEREDGTRFVAEIGDGTPLYLVVELRFARATEGGIDDVELFAPPEGRQRSSFLARVGMCHSANSPSL